MSGVYAMGESPGRFEVIPPLADASTKALVDRLVAMNELIVRSNCDLLRALTFPPVYMPKEPK